MNLLDELIKNLFKKHWHGAASENLEMAKIQLHKNLTDQVNGYWSGHSAYTLMVQGGFLVDSKRIIIPGDNKCEGKKLTELGKMFMDSMAASSEKTKQSNHEAMINNLIESTGGEV